MIKSEKGKMIVTIAAGVGVAVYVGKLLQMSSFVSLLFAFSIACVITAYFMKVIRSGRIKVEDLLLVTIVVLSIASSGLSTDADYYKPAIIVLCTIICIDVCPDYCVDEKTKDRILIWFVGAALITNVLYYFGGLRAAYFKRTNAIALNFSNPNETAMWLTFLFIILFNGALTQKKRIYKLFVLICSGSLIPILYRTESRACLFAIVFFAVGELGLHFLRKKSLPNWVIWIVALSPAIVYFAYMYIFIPYYSKFVGLLSFLISEGKPLTSRRTIWGIVEQDFWKCLLLGKYSVYFSEQMHNSLATLYCRFGLIFTVIVCKKFIKAVKRIKSKRTQLAMLTVWMIGCFEASIFVGVSGLYVLVLVLPMYDVAFERQEKKNCSNARKKDIRSLQ